MSDKKALKKIGDRLDEMVELGLTKTDEYDLLSDDYQSLAQDLVIADLGLETWDDDDE